MVQSASFYKSTFSTISEIESIHLFSNFQCLECIHLLHVLYIPITTWQCIWNVKHSLHWTIQYISTLTTYFILYHILHLVLFVSVILCITVMTGSLILKQCTHKNSEVLYPQHLCVSHTYIYTYQIIPPS